jgi:hypothetical protein
MQHDQGFTGSHWTPPLGEYSLRIAPTAARATVNETMMQHVPTLLVIRPMEEIRGFNKSH